MAIKVTNYLKNLGKSIVYASAEAYKENTNIGKFIMDENNQQLAKDVYHGIRDYKTTLRRASEAIKSTNVYQAADFGFKSALSDLKTGKFYDAAREGKLIEESFDEDMGFDDFNFDEEGGDSSSSEGPSSDTIATIKTLQNTAEISTDAIAGAVVKSGKYNAEITKQSTSLIISQQAKFFGDLKNGIFNTNQTLSNLVNFNENAMRTHIENSRKFFDESTKLARENNAILKEMLDMERVRFKEEQAIRDRNNKRRNPKEHTSFYDILDANGLPNLLEYGEAIKKNFKNNIDDILPGISSVIDMDPQQLKAMFANPLSGLITMAVSSALGDDVKRAHRSLDKTFGGIFSNLIAELNLKSDNSDNLFASTMSKIFGLRTNKKTSIDTSKYEKGAVPFDGKTRKSILEVIPTYLSQITSALTGEEPVYFDFDAGKWTKRSKVKEDFNKRLEDSKKYATSTLEESVKNALASLENVDDTLKKSVNDAIKEYAYAHDTLSGFEQNNMLSEEGKKIYSQISSKIDKRNIANDTLSAKNTITKDLKRAELNGDDIRSILFNKSNKMFKSTTAGGKNSKGGPSIFGRTTDEYGFDQLDYLQHIYEELNVIRRYGSAIGGDLPRDAKKQNLDGGDFKLPENYLEKARAEKEKRDQEAAEAAKNNPDKVIEKDKYDDVEYDASKDMSTRKDANEEKLRNIGKKFKTEKVDAILDLAEMIVKEPRNFIAGSLSIADRGLYNLFFEHKFKDKDGKEISGFFDLLGYKVTETFTSVKNYLTTKVFKPAWNWIKGTANDFASAFFGKTFFSDTKEAIKSDARSVGDKITNAGKNAVDAATSTADSAVAAVKNKLNGNKPEDEQKDDKTQKTTDTSQGKPPEENLDNNYNGSLSVPADGITTISKGEMIIPADLNPFNPDVDKADRNDDRRREKAIKDNFLKKIYSHADGTTSFDPLAGAGKGKFNFVQFNQAMKALKILNKENNKSLGQAAGEKVKDKVSSWFNNLVEFVKSKDEGIGNDLEEVSKDKSKLTARGVMGGGAGALVGGILAGPLGIMAGALAGGVVNILRDSESAKDLLLGKKDENEKRTGGVIPKSLQDTIHKYAPDLMKIGLPSAVASGLLLGTGPLGMAVIGSGAVMAKNSKSLQESLFGKDFTITNDDGSVKKFHKEGLISKKVQDHFKKNIPGIGASVLGTIAFGPFGGLLPNMILGTGVGMVGTSETFKNLILGYKDPRDPEGKSRHGGLVGVLKDNFVNPMIKFGKFMTSTAYKWFKESFITPISKWTSVIGRELMHQGKNLTYYIKEGISWAFEKTVGVPLYKVINEKIISPITKGLSSVGKTLLKGASYPLNAVRAVGKFTSNLADKVKLNQYGRGAIGNTISTERLMDAASMGRTYKTMGFDQDLAGMDAKEAEELEAKLLVLQGKSGAKKAYRNARQDFSTQMSRYFRGKENDLIKRLRKRFENEDLTPEQIAEEADNIAKDKNLSVKEKEALVKVLTDYGKKIETARKAAQEDSKLQDQYRTELMNKFGGKGYDFTNGRDINNALNAVHKDRIAKESTAYKDEAEKAIEASKKIEEDKLVYLKKVYGVTQSIGSMIAKKFGFDPAAFSILDNSETGDVPQNTLTNVKNEAEKAIEASKKIDEDKLVYLKKVYGVTQSIGSMIAKKFGFDPTAFAILGTSETGDVPQNTLTNVKNDSKAESENKEKDKAKNNVSTTTTDAEGNIWKTATDGSKVLVGSEANADKKRAKDAEDKKQQGWFASIGDKLKGFVGLGGKKEKKEEGGFLHNLADSLMGKSGALFSILKGGALAAIAGPLIIKALPIITQFLKDNKDAIIDAGKEVFKGIVEIGKEAVGMIFDSIADSFKNGDFATGLLQIVAGAFIGNKMLGGLPGMVLSKGGGMLYDRFKNRNKGKETTTKNTETTESNKKGKKGKGKNKRSKQKNKAAKMSENASTAATETKATVAAETGGKSGSKGKWGSILSGVATAAGLVLPFMSESSAETAEASGGIQPGQMYAANEDGELELIDENGKAINDGDQDNSSGDFMDTLNTILDIKYSVSDFFKKDTSDVSLSEEAGSIAEDARNTKPEGTSAFSKFTQKMNDIKTKAMNKITPITESISNAASKTKGKVKGMSDKALIYLKNLLTAGIDKVKTLMPGLSKKLPASMVQKLSNEFIASLVKNGSKYMTKIAAQIGVAMTGVGAIPVAIVNLVSAFDNIYNEGWRRWYNNADVLYNEDLGDDVKYVSVLAGAISTLLFSVIPVKWVFKTLASILGLDLSQAQARAQEAVDDYNADKESHPKGAPDTVADVEEYNAMYEKGLLESVKDTGETLISFGKDTLTKMNQAAKNIYKYVGDKATAAKNWAKNNAKWLAENGMNWFKQAYQSVASTASNLKDRAVSFVKNKYESAKQTLGEVKDEVSARAGNVADAWNNNSGIGAVVAVGQAATSSEDYKKEHGSDKSSSDSGSSSDSSSGSDSDAKGQGKHGLFGRGYYKQTQYANVGFNVPGDTIRQTIGDSGCGPVAAVNALQALGRGSGANDPVIQASSYALNGGFKGKDTGTDPRFFNSYASKYNASAKDIAEGNVKTELQKGHPVVLSGEDPNGESNKHPFAEYPHYVTATGYNAKNDTVTIQDPESRYDNQRYKLSNVLSKTTMAKSFSKNNKNTSYNNRVLRWGRGTEETPTAENCELVRYAEIVSGITGVRSDFILAQIIQESGWEYFKPGTHKPGYNYGNAGGAHGFATYNSLEEAAEFMANKTIAYADGEGGHRSELAAASQAGDPAAFAQILKDAGYYEAPLSEYTNGVTSVLKNLKEQGYSAGAINSSGMSSSGASAPQNSYGIFDAVMKPFDSLNNSLNQVMGGITSEGPFKQISDVSTKIFGSMLGGVSPQQQQQGGKSGGAWKGSTATSEGIRQASAWAEEIKDHVQDSVNPPYWYGPSGCTAFANDYLQHAGVNPINLYVPTAMAEAKSAGMWKDASQPAAEGDVGIIDTDGSMDEPDHAVIEDGQGGFWSNMTSGHKVSHGRHSDFFGNIWGYISTGSGNGQVVTDGKQGANDNAEAAGKHGPLALRFGRGGKSSNKAMNAMGKSISSANKRYGKGIISDTLKSAFNSGALNSSIQGIVGKVTGGNKDISNILDQVLPTPQTDASATNNTDLSQAGVIELLKIAVQLLTTIATNTGNMGSMSKEAVEKQQASINSAINSIGQMMAASNQSMMNGVSQMISSNNGMSYEQQHMSLSLDQLAAL